MDVVAATRLYLDYCFADKSVSPGDPEYISVSAKRSIEKKVNTIGIQQWQWWRVIGVKPFVEARELLSPVPESEDPGRAWILAWGFRLLGGVSPFLLLWLGAFAALPIFVWTSWELFDAGWPVAATVFLFALASSPFFVECLALPYSGVGFYLVSFLAVVPLATYGVLGHRTVTGGFLLRVVLAGVVFAACVLCQSQSVAPA